MHFGTPALILALLVLSIGGASCGGWSNANAVDPGNAAADNAADNSNSTRSNAEELGLIVKLPFDTEDVAWKQDAATKKVIAVMLLTPANADRLVSEAAAIRPPEGVSLPSETWFPAELIAQSATSGDHNLKGQAYAANAFYQEPYIHGRVTRIENTDYFVLELSVR